MSTGAWVRARSETLWHIVADCHDSGLALDARCGHTIWAPVHRRLNVPSAPADSLCDACQSAAFDPDNIRWPNRDPDRTTRLEDLSRALDALDELGSNGSCTW